MESKITFAYIGSHAQAMAAALKMIPETAKNRSISINRDPFWGHQKVVVTFTNDYRYAVIIEANDFFNPKSEVLENETNQKKD